MTSPLLAPFGHTPQITIRPLFGVNGRNTMPSILARLARQERGDASAGLYQHQRRLIVPDFGDNPHAHIQRIEQIKSMPAAMRPALGMSDNDVLACEIRRLTTSSMSKRMGFREAPPATLRTTRDR